MQFHPGSAWELQPSASLLPPSSLGRHRPLWMLHWWDSPRSGGAATAAGWKRRGCAGAGTQDWEEARGNYKGLFCPWLCSRRFPPWDRTEPCGDRAALSHQCQAVTQYWARVRAGMQGRAPGALPWPGQAGSLPAPCSSCPCCSLLLLLDSLPPGNRKAGAPQLCFVLLHKRCRPRDGRCGLSWALLQLLPSQGFMPELAHGKLFPKELKRGCCCFGHVNPLYL